ADASLVLTLGARPVGCTGARPKTPMLGEGVQPGIELDFPSQPGVTSDQPAIIVEQHLLGNPAEVTERTLHPPHPTPLPPPTQPPPPRPCLGRADQRPPGNSPAWPPTGPPSRSRHRSLLGARRSRSAAACQAASQSGSLLALPLPVRGANHAPRARPSAASNGS